MFELKSLRAIELAEEIGLKIAIQRIIKLAQLCLCRTGKDGVDLDRLCFHIECIGEYRNCVITRLDRNTDRANLIVTPSQDAHYRQAESK